MSDNWLSNLFSGESNPYGEIDAKSKEDVAYGKLHYFKRDDIVVASENPQILNLTDVEFSPKIMPGNFDMTVDEKGISVYSDEKRLHEALQGGGYFRLDKDGLAIIERLDLSPEQTPAPVEKPIQEPEKNTPEKNTPGTTPPKITPQFNLPEIKLAGRDYKAPESIDDLIQEATYNDPITYDLMIKIIGSESNFKNVASGTGPKDIAQVTGATAREYLHKNKGIFPTNVQKIISDNIAEPKPHKYVITANGSQANIDKLLQKPEISVPLAREIIRGHTIEGERIRKAEIKGRIEWLENPGNPEYGTIPPERIERLKEHLARDPNATDVKTYYLNGAFGGAGILVAHADTKAQNHKAADYIGKTEDGGVREDIIAHVSKNNKPVYYKNGDESKPRSVPEYMTYIAERVGNDIELASDLSRPENGVVIAYNSAPGALQ